jgi:hypothetical protein
MLRRTALLLAPLFLAPATARAQGAILVAIFGEQVATEHFHFGLRLGATVAEQTGIDGSAPRMDFNFGMTANIKLSDRLTLVPEFGPFSRKGVADYPLGPTGDPDLDSLRADPDRSHLSTNYIDLPILLRLRVTKDWSVGAGPQYSILTGAHEVVRSSVTPGTGLRTDVKDQLPGEDWAVVGDVAWTLERAVGAKDLRLHLRYTHGLSDVAPEGVGTPRYNRTLMFFAELPFIERPAAP